MLHRSRNKIIKRAILFSKSNLNLLSQKTRRFPICFIFVKRVLDRSKKISAHYTEFMAEKIKKFKQFFNGIPCKILQYL